MQRYRNVIPVTLLFWLVPIVAHAEADTCEKAADKSMEIRWSAYHVYSDGLADMADKSLKKIKDGMRKERDAAIPRCRKALEKDPELGKELECIIKANHALDMNLCSISAILLTSDICALSVDNRNRIKFEFERKRRISPSTVDLSQKLRLVALKTRWLTIEHCRVNKDEAPLDQPTLECQMTSVGQDDLQACNGSIHFYYDVKY